MMYIIDTEGKVTADDKMKSALVYMQMMTFLKSFEIEQ